KANQWNVGQSRSTKITVSQHVNAWVETTTRNGLTKGLTATALKAATARMLAERWSTVPQRGNDAGVASSRTGSTTRPPATAIRSGGRTYRVDSRGRTTR